MADSVDRVFAHALQTVRRIPRTGSARPPPTARLQLYGLYKQSMEGDVTEVMPRPISPPPSASSSPRSVHSGGGYETAAERRRGSRGSRGRIEREGEVGLGIRQADDKLREERETREQKEDEKDREARREALKQERDKWDAWYEQRGLPRTEAKKRYIETLIETMHTYASTTPSARSLITELEFIWSQAQTASPPSSPSPRILDPNSLNTEAEATTYERSRNPHTFERDRIWRSRVEKALAKMSTELVALRECLEDRRERKIGWMKWFGGWVWLLGRQVVIECLIWGAVVWWLHKKGRGGEVVRWGRSLWRDIMGSGREERRS